MCKLYGADNLFTVFIVINQEIVVAVALPLGLFFDEAVAKAVDGLYGDGEPFFQNRFDDTVLQFLAGPIGKGQA